MKGLLPTDPGHDKFGLVGCGGSLEGPDPRGYSTRDEQLRPVMIVAWGLGPGACWLAGSIRPPHPPASPNGEHASRPPGEWGG